jgi:hypothetical protein
MILNNNLSLYNVLLDGVICNNNLPVLIALCLCLCGVIKIIILKCEFMNTLVLQRMVVVVVSGVR